MLWRGVTVLFACFM